MFKKTLFKKTLLALALALVTAVAAGIALAGGGTLTQAKAAGWDCNPEVLIIGYYHCAPPGKPSVLDLVTGATTAPSIQLKVFHQDGTFAGTESLRRHDLYAGQPCPADNLATWGLLDLPVDYYACHHFDT